ncbi:hypothetical protein QFC24_003659 [Naganishia onofrii]|uniref:Uncharacterized protein n=1 Tax=Naganishia onofrii TaxID=1851511 RepID=A0ACC2XHD2_9TREE|nr:hypothetical protein QFC24_003659 [Naganishia onofrii]
MSHYKYHRAVLLALGQSPLAVTSVDARLLARFSTLLSAEHSPSAAQAGQAIKGCPMTSAAEYPPVSTRQARESPSTAVTTARWANSYKTSSHSAVQFNRDNYAAEYATPFTPDHSLMKPVDLSAWTPSVTTPLITPYNQRKNDQATKVEGSIKSSECGSDQDRQEKHDRFNPALKPSAKVFIPSTTPLLVSNPQPKRTIDTRSLPARHPGMQTTREVERTKITRKDLSVNSPSHSLGIAAHYAPFEVPKALTPLALPSATLPARPIACAVAPNLPRWAHSPGHAMLASLDSRHKPGVDGAMKVSMIRRASVSVAGSQELPGISRTRHSVGIKQVVLAAQDTDDSGEDDEALMSCVRSTSMTPWAIQRARQLSTSLLGDDADLEDNTAIAFENTSESDWPITARISAHQMKSPDSVVSKPTSVKPPSSAVRVAAGVPMKGATSFDGYSWRSQVQSSWAPSREPRKPNSTPSIPGGLLGAVPMHSVQIK